MSVIEKKLLVERTVTTGYKCNNCKKIVKAEDQNSPKGWYSFNAQHTDYDEYWEDYDVCSPQCYIELLNLLVSKDFHSTSEIDNMDNIFIVNLLKYIQNQNDD